MVTMVATAIIKIDKDHEFKSKQVLFSADEVDEMEYDLALYGVTVLQSVVYT